MSRILIIDDEKNIRRTFGMVLKSEGFKVTEAASGEDGLVELEKNGADLYTDFGGFSRLRAQAREGSGQGARAAAEQAEALLLGMMIKSMRAGVGAAREIWSRMACMASDSPIIRWRLRSF